MNREEWWWALTHNIQYRGIVLPVNGVILRGCFNSCYPNSSTWLKAPVIAPKDVLPIPALVFL